MNQLRIFFSAVPTKQLNVACAALMVLWALQFLWAVSLGSWLCLVGVAGMIAVARIHDRVVLPLHKLRKERGLEP